MDVRTQRWNAVLFDLDGTLADTVELILLCYRHTMRTHRGEELPDERWLSGIGTPLRDQLREFARSDEEVRAMLDTFARHQRRIHDEHVRPFEGAMETVEALRGSGVSLAIVTSKRREMALRTLAECGLADHFGAVVTASDVEAGKPDPEPVRRALDLLGRAGGEDVLFVGDSPYDIRAGRGAGVRTAGALWGPYAPEDLRVEEPDFLLESVTDVAPGTGDFEGG